jgi:tetratricopeptide (TPR) repeat protein
MISFLIALLSKENAIIFLLFIPIICHFFIKSPSKNGLITVTVSLLLSALLFLIIRGSIIGWSLGDSPMEMMNNPFIKLEGNRYLPFTVNEKIASVLLGLGKYIQLLFFPHPLTHDYYPRQFSVVGLTDPAVLASLVMQLSLMLIAIIGIFKKSFISFCILFYYGAISLMANILFPIGTHISERFLFTAALPFCLMLAYFSYHVLQQLKFKNLAVFCLSSLLLLYSIKTFSRNKVWKDDFTLFTTDVQVSTNSAKIQNAAGGALIDRAITLSNPEEKRTMLQSAIPHLNEAIKIHPNYKNAHLLLGNAYLHLEQYDPAIASYDNALRLDPYFEDATKNLLIALNEGARYFGSKEKNYLKAQSLLARAIRLQPNDYDANSLMGIALGNEGKHKEALSYFEKALSLRPDLARAYVNKGYALLGLGEEDEAQLNFQKAVSIDPNAMNVQ